MKVCNTIYGIVRYGDEGRYETHPCEACLCCTPFKYNIALLLNIFKVLFLVRCLLIDIEFKYGLYLTFNKCQLGFKF